MMLVTVHYEMMTVQTTNVPSSVHAAHSTATLLHITITLP